MNVIQFTFIVIFLVFLGLQCQKSDTILSSDGNNSSWLSISDVGEGLNKMFFLDQKTGWVVGDSGKIYYTNDGGISWANQLSSTENKLISIYFEDETHGWITGYNSTLLLTQDGGDSWEKVQVTNDSSLIYSSIHADKSGNLWFITNSGNVYHSLNNGENWDCKYKFNETGYSYLFFPVNDTGFAMKSMGNTLKITNDGGNTWHSVQFNIKSNWTGAIFMLDAQHGWISENWLASSIYHDSSSIYETTDGGITWTPCAELPGLCPTNIVFVNKEVGWLRISSSIYITKDGGKNWIKQYDADDGYIKDLYFLNSDIGWAFTHKGKILKYEKI